MRATKSSKQEFQTSIGGFWTATRSGVQPFRSIAPLPFLMCIHAPIGKKDRSCFVIHPLDGNPTGSSIRAAQPVTDPGFGHDELRTFVVGFNFQSELSNKDPQILRIGRVVPELLE
jgi:hypothetical protein